MTSQRRADTEPEWFQCHYCGCHTNARVRACCVFGRVSDLKRLESSVIANWEKEAEHWLPERDGRGFPGSWVEDPGSLLALYAARVLVLLDEVERLRGCRDGMGQLAQELGQARRAESDERSRVVEALRLLGPGGVVEALTAQSEVREVLRDGSWYYVGQTRYCARCRSRECDRQSSAFPHVCEAMDEEGEKT